MCNIKDNQDSYKNLLKGKPKSLDIVGSYYCGQAEDRVQWQVKHTVERKVQNVHLILVKYKNVNLIMNRKRKWTENLQFNF